MLNRALAAAMFLALVCAPAAWPQTPGRKQPAPGGRSAKPAAKSDAAIEAAIRAKFAKSKISADKFEVRVQGGVAVIEGRTGVVQRKGVATRLARSGGAASVDNRIQVSEAARRKAADNLAKGRRRAQVKRGEAR